jgi:hypothetical protein
MADSHADGTQKTTDLFFTSVVRGGVVQTTTPSGFVQWDPGGGVQDISDATLPGRESDLFNFAADFCQLAEMNLHRFLRSFRASV